MSDGRMDRQTDRLYTAREQGTSITEVDYGLSFYSPSPWLTAISETATAFGFSALTVPSITRGGKGGVA